MEGRNRGKSYGKYGDGKKHIRTLEIPKDLQGSVAVMSDDQRRSRLDSQRHQSKQPAVEFTNIQNPILIERAVEFQYARCGAPSGQTREHQSCPPPPRAEAPVAPDCTETLFSVRLLVLRPLSGVDGGRGGGGCSIYSLLMRQQTATTGAVNGASACVAPDDTRWITWFPSSPDRCLMGSVRKRTSAAAADERRR